MKKKQLLSIVITGAVIIAVGVSGVVSNIIKSQFVKETKSDPFGTFNDLLEDKVDEDIILPEHQYIGVLRVVGEIGPTQQESMYSGSSSEYDHNRYLSYVDKLIDDKNNKGLMLYVDTPGGNVYESDEMYCKLMEYKEKTKRPVWAYFASEACSGGYYISSAADHIIANKTTWTGSIGVIVSLLNTKGLYDKLGIKEINITSGKNKAIGSSGSELTEEQREILQSLVDDAYNEFVRVVSEGRGMDEATVRGIADGRIYSANQAIENGLIDEVGLYAEAQAKFAKECGLKADEKNFYTPKNKKGGFWGSLLSGIQNVQPKSDAQLASDIINNKGKGVLQYYAK